MQHMAYILLSNACKSKKGQVTSKLCFPQTVFFRISLWFTGSSGATSHRCPAWEKSRCVAWRARSATNTIRPIRFCSSKRPLLEVHTLRISWRCRPRLPDWTNSPIGTRDLLVAKEAFFTVSEPDCVWMGGMYWTWRMKNRWKILYFVDQGCRTRLLSEERIISGAAGPPATPFGSLGRQNQETSNDFSFDNGCRRIVSLKNCFFMVNFDRVFLLCRFIEITWNFLTELLSFCNFWVF